MYYVMVHGSGVCICNVCMYVCMYVALEYLESFKPLYGHVHEYSSPGVLDEDEEQHGEEEDVSVHRAGPLRVRSGSHENPPLVKCVRGEYVPEHVALLRHHHRYQPCTYCYCIA